METSGDFYTVLGRALSAGHHFGSVSLYCLCEGTVHASALLSAVCWALWSQCQTAGDVIAKRCLACLEMLHTLALLDLLLCSKDMSLLCWWKLHQMPSSGYSWPSLLKANSRWTKPNWHSTHKTSKTHMSQFVLGKPGLNKPRSLAWYPNSVLCF